MPRTISKEYDSYSLDFKRMAVALTHHPDMLAIDIATKLGLHPVMLYRWRMEMRKGDLKGKASPKSIKKETDLVGANRRIEELEKELAKTQKENDFLKKLGRFLREQGKNSTDL